VKLTGILEQVEQASKELRRPRRRSPQPPAEAPKKASPAATLNEDRPWRRERRRKLVRTRSAKYLEHRRGVGKLVLKRKRS